MTEPNKEQPDKERKRKMGNASSLDTECRPSDSKNATNKTEAFPPVRHRKSEKWICKSTLTDWLMVLITAGLFYYTFGLYRQAINASNAAIIADSLTNRNLELSQRAYLSYGVPTEYPSNHQLVIPIWNYGHKECDSIVAILEYATVRPQTKPVIFMFHVIDTIIARRIQIQPGRDSAYAIYITLPALSQKTLQEVQSHKQQIVVMGTIIYDTGFLKMDRLLITVTYNPDRNEWVRGGTGMDIDFNKGKTVHKE